MSREWYDCRLNLFRWQMTKFRRQQAQQCFWSLCPVDQKGWKLSGHFEAKSNRKWTNIHDYSHLLIDQVTVQTRQIQTRQIIGQSPTIVYSVYSHKKMYRVHNLSLYVHILRMYPFYVSRQYMCIAVHNDFFQCKNYFKNNTLYVKDKQIIWNSVTIVYTSIYMYKCQSIIWSWGFLWCVLNLYTRFTN